jgi:hypothetical protein
VTHLIFGSDTINFEFEDFFVDIILSRGSDVGDSALAFGRNENTVLGEETVFVNTTKDISLGKDITLFDFSGFKLPELGGVQGRDIDSFWHKDGLGQLSNNLEGSLDTVEDLIENTWAKFN